MSSLFFIDNLPLPMRKNEKYINVFFHTNTFPYTYTHSHENFWEFTIITKGSIQNVAQDTTIYNTNTIFVSTIGDCHSLQSLGTGYIEYINIMVKYEFLSRVLNSLHPRLLDNIKNIKHIIISANTLSRIEQDIHNASIFMYSDLERYNEIMVNVFLTIINHFSQNLCYKQTTSSPFIDSINKIFSSTDSLLLTVNDLCNKLGYSRAHLDRLFHTYFNTTPKEYLIRNKMQYALTLLTTSDLTVTDIAGKIGFASLRHFNLTFKQLYHLTPTQYRKDNLNK